MDVAAATLDTTAVDLRAAASIEAAEARAWADLYAAAPAGWAAAAGLGTQEVGGALVLRWAATGRRYFSRAICLGLVEPASRAAIAEILDGYEPDAALCGFIVSDGLACGARSFIADIEAPSPDQAAPAYEYFGGLGFTRPYLRTHWTRC